VTVESVTITDGLATVNLSGEVIPVGDLSPPRMEAQLEQTAMQFDEVDDAIGLLHGGPLTEPLATPFGGVMAIFDVNGEQIRVWTTNDDTINDLYALEAGESDANIPNGPINYGNSPEGTEPVNVPWSWHYDPEQVEMAEVTIEDAFGRSLRTVRHQGKLFVAGEQTSSLTFRLDQLDAAEDVMDALVLRFEEEDGICKLARCSANGSPKCHGTPCSRLPSGGPMAWGRARIGDCNCAPWCRRRLP
jgi:hypothetical protein